MSKAREIEREREFFLQVAKNAITAVYSNTEVLRSAVREDLMDLRDDIDLLLDAITQDEDDEAHDDT